MIRESTPGHHSGSLCAELLSVPRVELKLHYIHTVGTLLVFHLKKHLSIAQILLQVILLLLPWA